MGNKFLGGLEEFVLLTIQGLSNDAYGTTIYQSMKSAGRTISIGSLYVTLGRLEEKGYVKTRYGDSTAERGGRAKKFFTLTGVGSTALIEADDARESVKRGLQGGTSWATS